MRIVDIVISAAIGGLIGFAASHYTAESGGLATGAMAGLDAQIDAQITARLDALGVKGADDLDSRISGGVAQFLADQPEAVMAALERHQASAAEREAEALRQTAAGLFDALTKQPGDPAFGADAATADVTLVEFFDYRCGYCKRSLETVLALAEQDPKLRVVLKEFPILGPESVAASQISLAAYQIDPTRYKALHAALMRHRGAYDKASLLGVAAEAGYDPVAIEAALTNGAIKTHISNGYEIAQALGIRGTPAFVIGDRVIPGAVSADTLREAIETARAANKG